MPNSAERTEVDSAEPVSIVIPHYGDVALTRACVDAISCATPEEHELIVVDNGTGAELPGRVIRNAKNLGFAAACNQGAAAAAHEMVLFLNNDTEPQKGWLSPLIEAMRDVRVGAAASAGVLPTGEEWDSLPFLVVDKWGRLDAWNMPPSARPPGEVPLLAACSLLVRRTAFDAIGGFDTGYWNGHEDIDLCLALTTAGWKLLHVPNSVVMHHVSEGRTPTVCQPRTEHRPAQQEMERARGPRTNNASAAVAISGTEAMSDLGSPSRSLFG